MGIPVGSGFTLKGQFPIDERLLFETIDDMKNYSQWFLPDMYLCFNKEDQNLYTYSVDNDEDPDTGRWRVFEGGASSSERFEFNQSDPSDAWKVQHNLNERYPSNVLCIDSDGNEIYGEIEYYSSNLLNISFTEKLSGKCIVVK